MIEWLYAAFIIAIIVTNVTAVLCVNAICQLRDKVQALQVKAHRLETNVYYGQRNVP